MKKVYKSSTIVMLLVILSGCVGRNANNEPTGFVWDFIGKPMEQLIMSVANLFNNEVGSYGLGIIALTIIIRLLIITPLTIRMMRANTLNQEKMGYIKPQLDSLNAKMKAAASQQERLVVQQEIMALQQSVGIKMISADGCLPLFIQLPIFSALYFATTTSPQVLNDVLWGIPLGQPSIVLMFVSSVFYFIQGLISQINATPEQKAINRQMLYMSPILNAVFAMVSPAGAVLYWCVGGIFGCLTSLYTVYVQKPAIKKEVEAYMVQNPVKFETSAIKDVTHTVTQAQNHTTQRRNAGKQNRN